MRGPKSTAVRRRYPYRRASWRGLERHKSCLLRIRSPLQAGAVSGEMGRLKASLQMNWQLQSHKEEKSLVKPVWRQPCLYSARWLRPDRPFLYNSSDTLAEGQREKQTPEKARGAAADAILTRLQGGRQVQYEMRITTRWERCAERNSTRRVHEVGKRNGMKRQVAIRGEASSSRPDRWVTALP